MSTRAQGHISSTASTATLDLQEILSSFASDYLISIRLSVSVSSDSTYSFSDNTHSFDDLTHFALPPSSSVTLNLHESALVDSLSSRQPLSCSISKRGEQTPASSYIPRSRLDTPTLTDGDSTLDITLVDTASPSLASAIASAYCANTPRSTLMPTIMVSNSTVALSVSLESLRSLHHDSPLAIRRGKQPPPTLSLAKPKHRATTDSDLYPDIPSAFLGSPTCHSPTFTFSSGDPSKFNMGLSAMCSSLKALVPAPPFSPTESAPARSPNAQPEPRWGTVSSATLPAVDEDEWAFTQDLVVEWHASRGHRADISPPPSPVGELPYVGDTAMSTPVEESTPPFSASTPTEPPITSRADEGMQSDVTTIAKQKRRKTVIIQAPNANAPDPQVGRLDKDDKVSSCAGDRSIDIFPGDFNAPVPFEMPVSPPPAPASTDGPQVVSPSPRPCSTPSGRNPIRGILKEKKSVRFSSVPSMHEYEKPDANADVEDIDEYYTSKHADIAPRPTTPLPDPIAQNKRLQLVASGRDSRKRPAPAVTPRKCSPLRESHLPTSSDGKGKVAKSPTLTATSPQAPSPSSASPRLPTLLPRNTMAKHPAVRALACRPPASSSPSPTRAPRDPMGSGVGGAVVGAPELQPPPSTPVSMPMPKSALRETQRRALVKAINTHQSLPKERKADVLFPRAKASRESLRSPLPRSPLGLPRDKDKDKSKDKENGVGERRAARAGSGPAWRPPGMSAGAPALQKGSASRMPVPLRNILTKLRT